MDSDLSLIPIAGEDDSLLRLTPLGDAASTTTSSASDDDAFFLVSPLHPPRSRPKEVAKANEDRDRDSVNKDNTNLNKFEEKKFSLQPQKMKRKKKGGFNMRKSLAWDRAFFEEEGVLNSEELSMITGSGSLSVIHEETSCGGDSAYLQDLDENLFKVVPGSTPKKDRITGSSPLSKHASPARDNSVTGSAGRRKVLSTHDSNRSGSKRSGCPRPMVSSSLKRPANVNTIKSATKEPRDSKLPVPCALSKTSKNVTVGASDTKRNQIPLHVNLNSTKTGLHNAKVGPMGKSSTAKSCTRPTRRNVANYVKSSPTKGQCPPVTETKNGLDVIKKQAQPSTSQTSYGRDNRSNKIAVPEEITSKQVLPSAGHASYCRDDRLRKVAVPLPHTGLNLPHTQIQTSKPSGLRMPSPSLSFFNQTKTSSLPGPHKSSSQPCKIPNVRQFASVNSNHILRPPSLRKMPDATNAGTVIGDINVQSSSSVPSAITPEAIAIADSVSQIRHVQSELKVPSNSRGYGMTGDHRKSNCVPAHGYQQSTSQTEAIITEEFSYMEDVKFQSDDKCLMDQASCLAFPPKSSEIQGPSLEKVADASLEVQDGGADECKIYDALSFSRCKDEGKDNTCTLKTVSRNPHVNDAQMLASDRKMDEINDAKACTSAPDNWQLVKPDSGSENPEHQDLLNPCYIEELVYQDDRSDLNNCVLDGSDVLLKESQHNNVLPCVESKVPEGNGAGTVEPAVSRNLYVMPPIMRDCRSNEVEMVDSPNVENIALVSGNNSRLVENHNLNTQFKNDICIHGQSSVELQNMDQEVDEGIDVIKEPLPGSPEDQSSVTNCRYSVEFNKAHELSGCPELRHPNIVAVQVSQEYSPRSDLNGTLHSDNTSLEEYEERDELVSDRCNASGSEPKCSNACTEAAPAIHDSKPGLGGDVDDSQLELAVTKSSTVEQLPENVNSYRNSRDASMLLDQSASVESDSSLKTSNEDDYVRTIARNSMDGNLRPSLLSDQTSPSGSILLDNEVDVLCCNTLAEDGEIIILESNHNVNDELPREFDDTLYPQEDKDAAKELKKSSCGGKQDKLVRKPPSDAVPFSDEWLAAIEAAGEEILTKKGGAVQNSPPDKSPPQLGPYSPVKRKQNLVIGPFDCTKYTNNPSGSQ